MPKVKFDRTAEHKKIGEIKVKDKGMYQEVVQRLPVMPISTNWDKYKKIDAIPKNF